MRDHIRIVSFFERKTRNLSIPRLKLGNQPVPPSEG